MGTVDMSVPIKRKLESKPREGAKIMERVCASVWQELVFWGGSRVGTA